LCDDGGTGSEYGSLCQLGDDCNDCGVRSFFPPPPETPPVSPAPAEPPAPPADPYTFVDKIRDANVLRKAVSSVLDGLKDMIMKVGEARGSNDAAPAPAPPPVPPWRHPMAL